MAELTEAGCVGFSQADATIVNTLTLQRALLYAATYGYTVWLRPQDAWLGGGVAASGAVATRLGLSGVPVAAETIALHTLFELVRGTGARLHLCRLSSAAGVELLRQAKAEGLPVTADVSINSLHLTDVDVGFFNAAMRVAPPLRQQRDRDALQAALVDGTLDALVSDHSPVSSDEKTLPFGEATPGATGLELLLGLALQLGPAAPADHWRRHWPASPANRCACSARPSARWAAVPGAWSWVASPTSASSIPRCAGRCAPMRLVSQGKHTPFAFDISGFELAGRVQTTLGGRRPGVRAQRRVMRAAPRCVAVAAHAGAPGARHGGGGVSFSVARCGRPPAARPVVVGQAAAPARHHAHGAGHAAWRPDAAGGQPRVVARRRGDPRRGAADTLRRQGRRQPLAAGGPAACRCGHACSSSATSKRDALRVVHQVADALRAGDTVAVFPEGTTGAGRELLPFHANLLQAAIATETPIQPVALRFHQPG